jgi:hypothetical protein
MRQVAQQKLVFQDAYPSQAEGGFAGTLSSTVMRALRAWEKRRFGKDYSCSWSKTVSTLKGKRRKANKPLTAAQKLKKAAWAKANPPVGAARERKLKTIRAWHERQRAAKAAAAAIA